jgi:hypothetical protein
MPLRNAVVRTGFVGLVALAGLAAEASADDLILRDGGNAAAAAKFGQPAAERAAGRGAEVEWVRVDAALLASAPESLAVELVAGERLWALRTELERAPGSVVWRGRFAGNEPGYTSVTLSLHDGFVHGFFETEDGTYLLRTGPDGVGVLKAAFDETEPVCGLGREARDRRAAAAAAPSAAGEAAGAEWWELAPAKADDVAQLGILVVYRPQLAEGLGGEAAVVALGRASIDVLNTTLRNSAIHARAYLAGVRALDASSPVWAGSVQTVLANAVNHPTISALRAETGGDIVSLFLEPGFPGGCHVAYAFLMSRDLVGPQMERRAINAGCYLDRPLTFAHEVGHNLGAHHDPGSAAPPELNSFPWSYAYMCCQDEPRFNTVMNSGQRINQFSNPDLIVAGVPAGIPEERDNARTLNLTAPIAAAFRPGEPPPAGPAGPPPKKPAAPRKLTAKALDAFQVQLAWSDVAVDEDVYLVERKTGAKFVEIMALGAGVNQVSFFPVPATPGKTVSYRVRARNAAGASGYSNVAKVKMPKP